MSALNTQPENVNYLGEVNFKFEIRKLPNVTYFTQAVSLPGVTLTPLEMERPLRTPVGVGHSTLQYEELTISFIVDEYMYNYQEIFDWMIQTSTGTLDPSDAVLTILTSNMNPQLEVHFERCYPVSLGALEFSSAGTETEYFLAAATFRYLQFRFTNLLNQQR